LTKPQLGESDGFPLWGLTSATTTKRNVS